MQRHSASSGIRDNRGRGPAHEFLSNVAPGRDLSVVSAYFTALAYDRLAESLGDIRAMRFLFGEPRFLDSLNEATLEPPGFAIEETGIELASQLRQRGAALRCADWIRKLVEVRSVRKAGLLHGKMIHATDGSREHAMVGSSNFTLKGMGFTSVPNIELNLIVSDDRDRTDLKAWFDEIWSDEALTHDVKHEVLRRLERLYRHNSPEFIYFKTLFHLFGDALATPAIDEGLAGARFTESAVWKALFEFQRDGVHAVLRKLDAFGGCVLADSVGLGKTFTALAVVKWHQINNQRTLVLCPRKLRENWTDYLGANNSDLNPLRADDLRYTVLSHTDVARTSGRVGDIDLGTFNWDTFDLVVIDESHNFRNAGGSRYRALIEKVLRPGTKVLMLSATPVNNDLADLKAQLDLVAKERPDAFIGLGVANLPSLIGDARRKFATWSKAGGKDAAALMQALPAGLTSLLDGVSIARSRRHVERHYAASLDRVGHFPVREVPQSHFSEIDTERRFPEFGIVDAEIGQLKLALYNPFEYVHEDHRPLYSERDRRTAGFDQKNREKYLVAMMKVGFLKRLESSVSSFGKTMDRIRHRIDARLADIDRFAAAGTAVVEESPDDAVLDDEDLAGAFEVGGRLKYDLRHIDTARWISDLRHDRDRIDRLAQAALEIGPGRDAKLATLRELVADKANNPTVNRDGTPNRKLILFTAYTDTARYLYDALSADARRLGLHVGLVTGDSCAASFGRQRFQDILVNFAPRTKRRSVMRNMDQYKSAEIDLLIATDCISEGQNLQDCDRLVNVDIHWNPVRLIQRFGRIDRIGSVAESIRMVNFWPTADLDRYLSLKDRVEARMALVDLSATGEDNLLAEAKAAASAELHWRDAQLKRLQTELFDLEDAREGVSLTEFTLDDFRADLLGFAKEHRDELASAPLGLNAIAPAHVDGGTSDPGVIFCLQRAGDATRTPEAAAVNPLDPFYLVYMRDDGTVRHGFAQPKSVLNAMQALCTGRAEPFEKLCDAFDDETAQGSNLDRYGDLVRLATTHIGKAYASRAAASLVAARGGKLADETAQPRTLSDYQLVTWLIVRPEADA